MRSWLHRLKGRLKGWSPDKARHFSGRDFDPFQASYPGYMTNRSFRTWESSSEGSPDRASYHWWRRKGRVLLQDGERTLLPGPAAPGREGEIGLKVIAPAAPGRYLLAVDFVREGIAWFRDFGSPCLPIPVKATTR